MQQCLKSTANQGEVTQAGKNTPGFSSFNSNCFGEGLGHCLGKCTTVRKQMGFLHMGFLNCVNSETRFGYLLQPEHWQMQQPVPCRIIVPIFFKLNIASFIPPLVLHFYNLLFCFWNVGKSCDFFMKTTPPVYFYCIFRDIVLIERELANLRCKQWLAFALTHVVNITDLSCWVMWEEERLVADYWTAQHRAHLAPQMRGYSNE